MNRSLSASGTTDPVLARRASEQIRWINEVHDYLARRVVTVPWQAEPPTGESGLRRLSASTAAA